MPLEHSLQFGHDLFGRTLWSLLPLASLRSAAFAGGVTLASLMLVTIAPLFLAFLPRRVQPFARWLQDLLLPLPPLALSLSLAALSPPSHLTLGLALLLGTFPGLLRFVLARTEEILTQDYALQSIALGASPWRVLKQHLLPALPGWMRTQFPHLFSSALVGEATLSYLGVGAPLGEDTLGSLLVQGKEYAIEAPWILGATSMSFLLLLGILFLIRRKIPIFPSHSTSPLLNFEE